MIKINKKILSVFLTIILMTTMITPAFANEVNIKIPTDKEIEQSGTKEENKETKEIKEKIKQEDEKIEEISDTKEKDKEINESKQEDQIEEENKKTEENDMKEENKEANEVKEKEKIKQEDGKIEEINDTKGENKETKEVKGEEKIKQEDEKIEEINEITEEKIIDEEVELKEEKQIKEILIETENSNIKEGEKINLQAKDQDGIIILKEKIIWQSLNEDISKVNKEGVVTGLKEGRSKILVKLKADETVKKQIEINVESNKQKPLELVSTSPKYIKGDKNTDEYIEMGVNTDAEISLTFNQPVEFNKDYKDKKKVLVFQGSKKGTCKPYPDFMANFMLGTHNIEFSNETPETVIIKLRDKKGPIELKQNYFYKVNISSKVIKAKNSDELYKGTSIEFATFPEVKPEKVQIKSAPTRINVGKSEKLEAVVKNVNGEIDYKVNWETSDENIALVEDGVLIAKNPGRILLKAVADGTDIYAKQEIEIRENFSKQLIPKWTYKIDSDAYSGHPILSSDGSIYSVLYLNDKYTILALNLDGTKKDFNNLNVTAPISIGKVSGIEYIFAANKDKLMSLNPHYGNIEWKVNLKSDIRTTPVINKYGNIIVGCENNRAYGISGESKQIVWEFDTEEKLNYTPTLDEDGNIYIVSGDSILKIDGKDGSLLWKFENPEATKNFNGQVTIGYNNTVYIQDENTIYSINTDKNKTNWSKNFKKVNSFKSIVEEDGVYFNVSEKEDDMLTLHKFSHKDGSVIQKYPYKSDYGISIQDGNLYTNKAIYDENRNPIAYYDDYRYNLPWFQYSDFCLGKDGTIYRLMISEGDVIGLEAVTLYDTSNSHPCDIKLSKENLNIYTNSQYRTNPQVIDENEAILPRVEIEWSSNNKDIASVTKDGVIQTYDKIGETIITVKVKGTDIMKTISVEVKEMPTPEKLNFVKYKGLNTNIKDQEIIKGKITEYTGQGFDRISVFVQDKDGNFIPKQNIQWEVVGDEGILEIYYDHGGNIGGDVYYGANITAKKAGTAVLRATLKVGEKELKCETNIEILPNPYDIKWSVLVEGDWDNKDAYHTMTEDKIFYVNQQKLFAINKKGEKLWESKVGVDYGVQIEKPIVGKDGYLYLYSVDATSVFKINTDNGEVVWKIREGNDPIKELKTTKNKVYALTDEGKLYCIDDNGQIVWEKEFPNNGGILISKDEKVYISQNKEIKEINKNKIETIYTDKDGKLYLEDIDNGNNLIAQKSKNNKYSILSINKDGNKNWEYKGEDDKGLNYKVALSCDKQGNVIAVDYNDKEDKNVYFINKDKTKINIVPIKDDPVRIGVCKPLIAEDGQIYISLANIHIFDMNSQEEKYTVEFKGGFTKTCWARTLTVDKDGTMYLAAGEKGIIASKGKIVTPDKFQIDVQGLNKIKLDSLTDIKIDITDTTDDDTSKDIKVKMYLNEKNDENNKQLIYTTFKDKISKRETKSYNCSIKIPRNGQYEMKVELYKIKDNKETLIHEFNKEIEL
ncbi:PQQ-binding-like beta-propeller repeat protein [Tepidibacter hydrothermalis]|uniref:PQQ-binding-like beta-propeller repeat protein n=1 Tax=Tepidibacter hydrothermalis TaxID=3036126 RepID=A0ABY8EGU0_9FIRM|nr:PQQ-binding-like beta-propeller repeat protein [Tepidibacter hydrothermalis]WFD10707.1 PQQ-binding-like beta-propeller repeat protein [Tepidibacter hydrothermalis]